MVVYDDHRERKIRYGMLAIVVIVVAICLTISIIGANNRVDETVIFTNESGPIGQENDAELLSDQEVSLTKQLVQELYGTNKVEVAIRWNSVQREEVTGGEAGDGATITSFLVDIDAYRQTYRVSLADEVTLSCAELNESKYPDSFCVGGTNDSFDVVFGTDLPHSDATEAGDFFAISRSAARTSSASATNPDNTLRVDIYSCPADDVVQKRVEAAVDAYIVGHGATPSIFEKSFFSNCAHGE